MKTFRDRWEVEDMNRVAGVVASDREEARCADRFDTTWYRRIGTELVSEDDIPALSDIPLEDWAS